MQNLKFVAVGDGAVGKTCALLSYCTNQYDEQYIPTVFDNYACNVMVDGKIVGLQCWDTAGQEDYDHMRPLSYAQTDVFILFYSVISPSSFANLKSKWIPELRSHCPNTPIVVVGSKIDLRDQPAIQQHLASKGLHTISRVDGDAMARDVGAAAYCEISSITQEGLKEMFDTCIIQGLKARNKKPPKDVNSCCTIM